MWYNNKGERFTNKKFDSPRTDRKRYFMAKVIFNGVEFKSATAVKAQARIDVMEIITTALRAAYGEDNVAKVGSNEYGVVVGQVLDKDGFPADVTATVKPTVKEWESRKTDKRTYEQFILAEAAEVYTIEIKEKEEKKEKERQEKEKKKARDKKAREEKEKEEKAKTES